MYKLTFSIETYTCSKQLCDRGHDNYVLKNELRQAKSITVFHVCKILHW